MSIRNYEKNHENNRDKRHDPLGVWRNYIAVARTAFDTGDLPLARVMYAAAVKEACDRALSSQEALASHGLAIVLIRLDLAQDAARLLRKALRLYSYGSPLHGQGMSAAACVLSDLYCHAGEDQKALPLLKATMRAIRANHGDLANELTPLAQRLALIYSRHGQTHKAGRYLALGRSATATASSQPSFSARPELPAAVSLS